MMNERRSHLFHKSALPILLFAMTVTTVAEDSIETETEPSKDLEIYLLLGQSNMAGRGRMTEQDQQPVDGIWMLDKHGQWQPACHPLHFDKAVAGVGLGIDFAKTMKSDRKDVQIGLVPCAVGGTSIDQWQKGEKLYETTLKRAKVSAKQGKISGILWHQGERDAWPDRIEDHKEKLKTFFTDIRSDLGDDELPIVMGELGTFLESGRPASKHINEQLQVLAEQSETIALASSEGLDDKGDQLHFSAKALKTFGKRYGQAMLGMQSKRDVEHEPSPTNDDDQE